MRKPIYHAFRAANVEEALAAEAAASIPDDVVSREEFLEAVNRFETRLDEVKDAVAENKIAIAKAAAKNEAAIATANAALKVEIIRWVLGFNTGLAAAILGILKLL